jgi:hypothetical protein
MRAFFATANRRTNKTSVFEAAAFTIKQNTERFGRVPVGAWTFDSEEEKSN